MNYSSYKYKQKIKKITFKKMVKLTKELLLQKCKTDNILKIKKMDIFGSDLDEISQIKELKNLEVCSLSLN